MDDGADRAPAEYVLGSTDRELARLEALSRVYAPVTATWLDGAGLQEGMAVADLGCGLGDVTRAVAERVGPTGTVTGVDNSARPLEVARRRAAEAGCGNVVFEQGDVTTWRPAAPVDAVVGRLILVHLPDPVGLVRRVAGLVRPGGVVAFQEVVLSTRAAQPSLPLLTAFNGWILATFGRLGRPADMGLRLAAVFAEAGLADPELTSGAPLERGPDAGGWSIVGGDVTSLLPAFERTGVATAAEVGPETFERRLRQQAAEHDAVLVNPLVVGAVARTGGQG
jgi:SAM-dependent methyltransferase